MKTREIGKITGTIIRGIILGILLLTAILVVIVGNSGEYIFRYQGF